MPLRVDLSSGLGHARSASNAWPLEEGEKDLSEARRRVLVLVAQGILLTSSILHCLELPELPPGAKPACQKRRRCACSSLPHASWPERKVTSTLCLARHAMKNGARWLRSETGYTGKLTPATAMAVGIGCSENVSGAKAFGCFLDYSETKFRMPVPRGLTLLLNRTRRHAASGRRGRLSATDLAGRLTYAVAGRFEQWVRPRSKRLECLAAGRR
jgi:hypothetical protein